MTSSSTVLPFARLPLSACCMGLPRDAPSQYQTADEADLINEFETGRSYLLFQMSVQLCSYIAPPCLLFACTHHNKTVQHRAL